MGDDRPSRYIETRADGSQLVVYRASSLARCDRAFAAMAMGLQPEPTPEFMLKVFAEGHQHEATIRQMFEAEADVEVVDDQLYGELDLGTMYGRQVVIRGAIDGRYKVYDEAGDVIGWGLFEAKKFRDSTWPNAKRQGIEVIKHYPIQDSAYWHMHDNNPDDPTATLPMVEMAFTMGHLETIEGEGGQVDQITEIKVQRHLDPPVSYAAIVKRILHVETLIHQVEEGQQGLHTIPCPDPADYPCPYYPLHDEKKPPTEDAFELPEDAALTDALSHYYAASEAAREASAAAKKASDHKKKMAAEVTKLMAGLTKGAGAYNPDDTASAKWVGGSEFGRVIVKRTERNTKARQVEASTTSVLSIELANKPKSKGDSWSEGAEGGGGK